MLTAHILNVGQGASVIIKFADKTGTIFWGLIDSNCEANAKSRALQFLQDAKCEKLAFVALSHPHRDHYSGLHEVLQAYDGKISEFYSFPMGGMISNNALFMKMQRQNADLIRRGCDDPTIRQARVEFIQILRWADQHHVQKKTRWVECEGEDNGLAPDGFAGVNVRTILPPKSAKGSYVAAIHDGKLDIPGVLNENELSLAFSFSYAGVELQICCDGTAANWAVRQRFMERKKAEPQAAIVNLLHHGSKLDCTKEVMSSLFSNDTTLARYAVTSAGGISHPDPDNIQWLAKKKGILPYCSNLMPMCGAKAVLSDISTNVTRELGRWLRELSVSPIKMQTCQGDITVNINPDGTYSVEGSVKYPCWLRNEWSTIL